jgi:hypothetical protein
MGCVLRNKELYSSPISVVVKHFGFAAYGAFWSVGLNVGPEVPRLLLLLLLLLDSSRSKLY